MSAKPKPDGKPMVRSGLAAAMRADAEAARVVRPGGIWSRESVEARRARIHAALGTESVDAAGLSGNHRARFLQAGWREEHDYTGRLIALHPPDGSPAAGSIRLQPPPARALERPYRGECLAPGCHKEVRRQGDRFCGSAECREWAVQARRARAQERAGERYRQDPKGASALRAAQARAKRFRDRRARERRHHCVICGTLFLTSDPKRRACDNRDHQKAWRAEQHRQAQARYDARHRIPKRLLIRTKPYRGKARYIVTEARAPA
jgi:hypothetical protein